MAIDLKCGDCLEEMKSIPDKSVDMILTSPPYADRRRNCYEGMGTDQYVDWFLKFAVEFKRILKPTGSFFLNIKPHCNKGERVLYVMKLVIALKEEIGFRFTDEFCWTKIGMPGKFNGRFKNAFEPVYHFTIDKGFTHNPYSVAKQATDISKARYKRKASGETQNGSKFAGIRRLDRDEDKVNLALPSNHIHFTQKNNQHSIQSKHPAVYPEELCEFFIKAFSNEGDIILDPFMGSGTTGVACKALNRSFIGIELDQGYFDIGKERILGEE